VNDALLKIEGELLRAARERSRRPTRGTPGRVVAASVVVLLVLASAASALTGVGPLGGLFASDDFASPPFAPKGSSERAYAAATGPNGERWQLLAYRRKASDRRDTQCLALARGRDRGYPSGGIECARPAELAAAVQRRGLYWRVEAYSVGSSGGPPQHVRPVYGLVRADAHTVMVRASAAPPRRAALSRPFALETGAGRRVVVRSFLAVPDLSPPFRGDETAIPHRPELTVTAVVASGGLVRERRPFWDQPLPNLHRPDPDEPQVRLTAEAGLVGWRLHGFETFDNAVMVAAGPATTPWPTPGWSAFGGSSVSFALSVADRGFDAQLPDSPTDVWRDTVAVYGLARRDVREMFVITPDGARHDAELSGVWRTIDVDRRELRDVRGLYPRRLVRTPRSVPVRAFLGVIQTPEPRSYKRLRMRAVLANGSVISGGYR
jgi:hypothetical protein